MQIFLWLPESPPGTTTGYRPDRLCLCDLMLYVKLISRGVRRALQAQCSRLDDKYLN